MINGKIAPLQWYFDTDIPTVFNDYMTYYEQIASIVDKVNELIAELDGYNEEFLEEAKEYTNQEIAKLKVLLENDYNSKIQKVEIAQEALNELVGRLDASLAKLYLDWGDYQSFIDSRFMLMYADLKQYILDNISTLENVMVKNPINGELENINSVLEQLYQVMLWAGITAEEFDQLMITPVEFDKLFITAFDFDNWARLRMFDWIYLRMWSPFTGSWERYSKIIQRLCEFHIKGITAQAFDALALTAEEFDNKNVTAYVFDWEGLT